MEHVDTTTPWDAAINLFNGDHVNALRWFKRPNAAFNWRSPSAHIRLEDGEKDVLEHIAQLKAR